ncbi:SH3 domain-containing protein [Streptococcus vestibularis]|nr:SH3 domain-containing protein [Streptococcus vestibularis]MBS6506215.1 SH3 domain-containing protein [Streptococcus vestibularis]MCY7009596.1 SH3 domain-containing protein [Streptococcus vestibularis]MCY7043039.1 SH3 domain-containing protein [Streptococcus vestibularis]
MSAKAEFYVNPGDSVFYDQVVTVDGHTWLSCMTVSGARRYVDIA